LTVPIQVDRQVTIQQSLTDQFFKSFEEQVALNGTYALPPDTPVSQGDNVIIAMTTLAVGTMSRVLPGTASSETTQDVHLC
jgi:hypothetical protein